MRAEQLVIWTEEPLNAETPLGLLCRSEVTPTDLLFVRNHGSVPTVDPDSYRLSLAGAVREPLLLSLRELRERFSRVSVKATLACAGNRRRELNAVAPVPDAIPWGAGAIGNAVWTGVRLQDLLLAAGIAPEARHVAFAGLDEVEANGRHVAFGGSIPLEKALGREVLLAYEVNGQPLPPEHGFPVRALVPGYIGARSVKWLSTITIQSAPSASFFQTRDYALDGSPLAGLPLNSAVCRPREGEIVRGPTVVAEGYAMAGGPRQVERVEVSADGGATWLETAVAGRNAPWTWRLWRAESSVPGRVSCSSERGIRLARDSRRASRRPGTRGAMGTMPGIGSRSRRDRAGVSDAWAGEVRCRRFVSGALGRNSFAGEGRSGPSDSRSEDVERPFPRAPGRIESIEELAPVVLLSEVLGRPRPRLHRRARKRQELISALHALNIEGESV